MCWRLTIPILNSGCALVSVNYKSTMYLYYKGRVGSSKFHFLLYGYVQRLWVLSTSGYV